MKYIVLLLLLANHSVGVFAQGNTQYTTHQSRATSLRIEKPALDTSVFTKWSSVESPAISNDGNYVLYGIRFEPYGRDPVSGTLIIQAIHESWKMEIPNVLPYSAKAITTNSQIAIFLNKNDSLGIVRLGRQVIEYIPHVSAFSLIMQRDSEFLVFQLDTPTKELQIRNLASGHDQSFTNVNGYLFGQDGNPLVLISNSKKDSTISQSLKWITLANGTDKTIWEGTGAGNLVLDKAGSQLAFTVEKKINNSQEKSIWYYHAGTDKAIELANNQSAGIDKNVQLSTIERFTKDGYRLFFNLIEKDDPKPKPDAVKVDIWSYTDAVLQSQQLKELDPKSYKAVIQIGNRRILRLQQENEIAPILSESEAGGDDFLFTLKDNDGYFQAERYWNAAVRPSYNLVSVITGERNPMPKTIINYGMSPGRKYAIGYDHAMRDIYTYELSTNVTHNITVSLPIPLGSVEYDRPWLVKYRGLQTANWLANDSALLVYDQFDIWQIDPLGKGKSINLTNGYGRKNKIIFRLIDIYSGNVVSTNEKLIVRAFNQLTKYSGFFRITIGKKENPELLSMEAFNYDPAALEQGIVKARDADIYLVRRQSATRSPNYFWTKNFKNFTPVSAQYPEKNYNWLMSKLVSFKTLDSRKEQAVLYKPENFDPKKKYPAIIYYYERMSQDLNLYQTPGGNGNGGSLDIAWFVSHGYIVFAPDIHYTIGETGQSAYNSIVAAGKFISNFPWVDAKHVGIQGHSFGGYETNYVVTHTGLFAAAVSSSGASDLISYYDGLEEPWGGGSHQFQVEIAQYRIGVSLWQRQDLYIKNSPIFGAFKVETPLLMVSNKQDGRVPFMQGVELFTALRRLGKKVWMLQYDKGSHGLGGQEYIDYLIRMTQFFDHYLKGSLAPKWMVEGIPAKMKGIDNGLELEPRGIEPIPGY